MRGLAASEPTASTISTQAPSKFTPGPWKAERSKSGSKVRISGHGWFRFARVWVEVADQRSEEGEANARLIAAAPDMLAALQMVRELDDAYGIEFSEQQRDQLHDAIRKATHLEQRTSADGSSGTDQRE